MDMWISGILGGCGIGFWLVLLGFFDRGSEWRFLSQCVRRPANRVCVKAAILLGFKYPLLCNFTPQMTLPKITIFGIIVG